MNFAQHLPVSLSWFGCAVVISWKILLFSLAPVSELRCAILCFGYFFWFYLGICLFHSYSWDHSGAANTLLLGEASTSCSQLELGQFSSLLWIIQAFPLPFSMDVYSVWDDFSRWDQMQAASSTAFYPKVPSLFADFKFTFGLKNMYGKVLWWPTKVINVS